MVTPHPEAIDTSDGDPCSPGAVVQAITIIIMIVV